MAKPDVALCYHRFSLAALQYNEIKHTRCCQRHSNAGSNADSRPFVEQGSFSVSPTPIKGMLSTLLLSNCWDGQLRGRCENLLDYLE